MSNQKIKPKINKNNNQNNNQNRNPKVSQNYSKGVILLGASGSIGSQSLDVIEKSDDFKLLGASVHKNVELLAELAVRHELKYVAITGVDDLTSPTDLIERFEQLIAEAQAGDKTGLIAMPQVFLGKSGLIELARVPCQVVLNAVVGLAGLEATMAALDSGHDVALANKETLVGAGPLVMAKAKEKEVRILPVDSEHSAIWQSIGDRPTSEVARILLTASGGPFRGNKKEDLEKVTVEEALAHPNWSMGQKISIDSATLMNKGLEVIEARWLFDIPAQQIQVLVHPQSILHSGVEFTDGAIIAQMGSADMRLPIQYALTYPERQGPIAHPLDLLTAGPLAFEAPDLETFPCLAIAYRALELGGYAPLIVNTADEVAVAHFLKGDLSFLQIAELIDFALTHYEDQIPPQGQEMALAEILKLDDSIRRDLFKAFTER